MILPSRHVSPSSLASLLFAGTAAEQQAVGTFVSLLMRQQELLCDSEQPGHGPTFFSMPQASSEMALEGEAALSQESAEIQALLVGKNPQEEREQQALYSILHSLQDLLRHLPADFSSAFAPLQQPPTLEPHPMRLTEIAAGKAPGDGMPGQQPARPRAVADLGAARLGRPEGVPVEGRGELVSQSWPVAVSPGDGLPRQPLARPGVVVELGGPAVATPGDSMPVQPREGQGLEGAGGAGPLVDADGATGDGTEPLPSMSIAASHESGAGEVDRPQELRSMGIVLREQVLMGTDGTPLDEPGLLTGRMFTVGKLGGPTTGLTQEGAKDAMVQSQPGDVQDSVAKLSKPGSPTVAPEALPLRELSGNAQGSRRIEEAGLQETARSRGPGVQFRPMSSSPHANSFPEYASGQPQQFLGEGQRESQPHFAAPLESPVPLDSGMVAQISARVVDTDASPVRSETPPLIATEREAYPLQRGSQFAMETVVRPAGHLLPHHTILLQLDPPELGAMQIRVRLTHEHLAASFWADSPEVRALIQSHFPALNQSLSEHGFQEHQISMSLATGEFSGQTGQFAQQHAALPSAASKDSGGTGRRGSALHTEHPAPRRYGRPGIVDVVI
jgi:Flagellar hook-length control protein FliK